MTYLGVVSTLQTVVGLVDAATVAVAITLTLGATVVADVAKVTATHVWRDTHAVWLAALGTHRPTVTDTDNRYN